MAPSIKYTALSSTFSNLLKLRKMFLLAVVFSSLLNLGVGGVSLSLFYPFGADRGDTSLEPADDSSSDEIGLEEKIVFYDNAYKNIYVNMNGHVSFDSEVPEYRGDLEMPLGLHLIAVFLADVDTRTAGRVYYRSSNASAILQRAAADIQTYFSGFENYVPTFLFIVTWDRVGYYSQRADKLNTFQLVLVTDGMNSFALFHYLDEGIQWLKSEGKLAPTYEDLPAQAGFENGKDGLFYTLPGSADTAAFVGGSNVNVPGVWMYHIGNTGNGNIRPADLNTGEVTLFEIETASDSCFQGAHVCHANAQCNDYRLGFCCRCVPPFYGNGLHCLEPRKAQQLNGRVTGTINGVTLKQDLVMHTYVVVTDGRTYSAISNVPSSVGPAMQTLNSVGGVIGWLFALKMNPNTKNGFDFTGGKFNKTTRVTFQRADGAKYVLRIFQEFMGFNSQESISMTTRLEGNVPEIPMGALVSVDDYHENYKRTGPGTIKSFVARTYRVNDVGYRYTWDTTITFDECAYEVADVTSDVMRLAVSRHYVIYDEPKQVVRFTMTSKLGVFSGDDPCSSGSQNCNEDADCVPEGASYRCVCRDGYEGNGQQCRDVDECTANPCDRNAQCYNVPGSFQCRCLAGFSGDGKSCRPDIVYCGDAVCDANARCVSGGENRPPRCECNVGFEGDGIRCSASLVSCRDRDICSENAQCVYDEDLRDYVCECMDEFSGDGFSCEAVDEGCSRCDRNAQCVFDNVNGRTVCQCNSGYTGDGRRCTVIDTCIGCDRNARCVFNENTSEYQCVCIRGYLGDGRSCELRDCREDTGMCNPEGGLCWHDSSRNFSICRCNYGYRGDGFNCQPVGCDEYNVCDSNAECVLEDRRYRCVCNEGFEGDGRRCRSSTGGCNVYNDCDQNARCVPDPADPNNYVCRCNRGYRGDGKVCEEAYVPCNQVNNCDRNAECIYDPDLTAYTCRCSRGFEGDGLTCRQREILDCRRDPRLCSSDAECVEGTELAYVCVCRPGFRGDGASCSPVVREGNQLLYAQGAKVMRVSSIPQRGDYGQMVSYIPGQLAVGVETDCMEGHVYWTDVAMGVIRRSMINGSGVETVANGLKSPEGLAIDFVARNMFFTDSAMDLLQVAKLDGSEVKTLVNTEMTNPRAIVLDINRGTVFWTDWNRNRPQIERMNMDGSERSVLVDEDLRLPNGLVFDSFSQTLCWGDAGTQSIECVRSDGVGRRVVFAAASYPFDITLLNNNIYWTDWERKDIPNVSQNGGDMNVALKQAVGGHGRVYGITAIRDTCPRARNSCGLNNGGCKSLCLPSENGGRTCACPDGVDPRVCM